MRVSIFALAFAACLAVPATAQTEAADATQSPPLAPRTADSGLPLTAAQEATGLPYLDLRLKVDPDTRTISGDARYTIDLGGEGNALMAGASYQRGTAYCQAYPVTHFNPCADNNPGIAAYGKLTYGPITLLGEYAQTTKEWEGTAVPIPTNPLSEFEAVKPEAFTLGGRFAFGAENLSVQRREFAVSAEFSKFISGEKGSPWRRQNQSVLGLSWFPVPNVDLFGEFIHVDGYVPLNFLSGGNFPDGSTWSRQDADTNVILAGAQVSF